MNKVNPTTRFYIGPVKLNYTSADLLLLEKFDLLKGMDCNPGGVMYRFGCDNNSKIKGLFEFYLPDGTIGSRAFIKNQTVGFGFKTYSDSHNRIYNVSFGIIRRDIQSIMYKSDNLEMSSLLSGRQSITDPNSNFFVKIFLKVKNWFGNKKKR